MFEDINEQVTVVAVFQNGKVLPYSFSWRSRKYLVERVNLEHQEKHGNSLLFCFSVAASGNSYELSFDNQHLIWELEKIWTE